MKSINKILFGIIIFVILIFLIIAGLVLWQKQKIFNIFSSGPVESDYTDNIVMGLITDYNNDVIMISYDQVDNKTQEYKILVSSQTKIYQDFSESRKTPVKKEKDSIQKDILVIIGLTTSKDDKNLVAEVIHILPNINSSDEFQEGYNDDNN